MRNDGWLIGLVCITIFITGCQKSPKTPEMQVEDRVTEAIETHADKDEVLVVALKDGENITRGTALLSESDAGVKIEVKADHLEPGQYGFHIHEKGTCQEPSFESAGGHFNPQANEHGLENEAGPHAGDLENIVVGPDGIAQQDFINNQITLKKQQDNALFNEAGTSLVMHHDVDDGITQPTGNAGARMLCGVIAAPAE